jgi:hypothetical protein
MRQHDKTLKAPSNVSPKAFVSNAAMKMLKTLPGINQKT